MGPAPVPPLEPARPDVERQVAPAHPMSDPPDGHEVTGPVTPRVAPPTRPDAVASTEAPVADTSGRSGPAAAARRALGEAKGSPPPTPAPTGAVAEAVPPAPPVPPPIAPVPQVVRTAPDPEVGDAELRSFRPRTPTEVVELAGRHLGLAKDVVASRASALLGDRPRTPETLAEVWLALVDQGAVGRSSPQGDVGAPLTAGVDGDPGPRPPDDVDRGPVPAVSSPVVRREVPPPATVSPTPESEPAATTPDAGSTPTTEDEIDLDDLVDAPSHTEAVIEQLTEAFPGAELHLIDPPEDP